MIIDDDDDGDGDGDDDDEDDDDDDRGQMVVMMMVVVVMMEILTWFDSNAIWNMEATSPAVIGRRSKAAASILQSVTSKPKVISEGWHPLPSRVPCQIPPTFHAKQGDDRWYLCGVLQ